MGRLTRGQRSMRRQETAGLAAWFEEGKTLGVAVDMEGGSLLVSVAGPETATPQWLVATDTLPLATAKGRGLFPSISGQQGACLRLNYGHDPVSRPFKIAPPSAYFKSAASLMAAAGDCQVRKNTETLLLVCLMNWQAAVKLYDVPALF